VVAWGWKAHGWTRIYTDPHAMPLWWMPVSLAIYLLVHDAWFYWTHRAMHVPRIFRIAHAVHHASRPPTAWAAMSFHPIEAITGAVVIPALVFVVPIHVGVLGAVLTIMTVMGVTNHMGWEIFPRAIVNGPWAGGSSPPPIISGTMTFIAVTTGFISVCGTGCAAPTRGWAALSNL
jgi:sterol desaturase/sphingolipid hydroxylase (fatty acid hydroxylase superfamily)